MIKILTLSNSKQLNYSLNNCVKFNVGFVYKFKGIQKPKHAIHEKQYEPFINNAIGIIPTPKFKSIYSSLLRSLGAMYNQKLKQILHPLFPPMIAPQKTKFINDTAPITIYYGDCYYGSRTNFIIQKTSSEKEIVQVQQILDSNARHIDGSIQYENQEQFQNANNIKRRSKRISSNSQQSRLLDSSLQTLFLRHIPIQIKYYLSLKLLEFVLDLVKANSTQSLCPQKIYVLYYNVKSPQNMKITMIQNIQKGKQKVKFHQDLRFSLIQQQTLLLKVCRYFGSQRKLSIFRLISKRYRLNCIENGRKRQNKKNFFRESSQSNFSKILINDKQTKKIQSSNQLIYWSFYPCSGFNALNISKVKLSGKPTVFFYSTFKIVQFFFQTAKINWDVLNLTNIKISHFWDLFQILEFPDDFRKIYKKGDDFIYESLFFNSVDGHEKLWTFNVQFID